MMAYWLDCMASDRSSLHLWHRDGTSNTGSVKKWFSNCSVYCSVPEYRTYFYTQDQMNIMVYPLNKVKIYDNSTVLGAASQVIKEW